MSKKGKIIAAVGIGLGVTIFIASIVFIIWFLFCSYMARPGFEKVETNPKNYLKVDDHFGMGINLFPKKVDEKRVIEYKYHPITGLLDDYEYLYLKYQYKKGEYKKEKERLSKIETEYTATRLDHKWLGKPVYVLYFNDWEHTEVAICNDDKSVMEYLIVNYPEEYHSDKYIEELKEDLTYKNRYTNCYNTMPLGKPDSEMGGYIEKIENKNRKVEKSDFVKVNGVKYVEAYVAKKSEDGDGYDGVGDTILWNIEKEKDAYRFKYTFDDGEEDLFEEDIEKYKLNKKKYVDKIYDLCFIYKRKYLDSLYKDVNKDGYQDAVFTGTKQLYNVREDEGVEEEYPIKKVFIYNKKRDKFIYNKKLSVD